LAGFHGEVEPASSDVILEMDPPWAGFVDGEGDRCLVEVLLELWRVLLHEAARADDDESRVAKSRPAEGDREVTSGGRCRKVHDIRRYEGLETIRCVTRDFEVA
jgi:hypothetical protein